MSLTRITFTGIDEHCDLEQLLALYALEPRLEFGILYRGDTKGGPRYPHPKWIFSTATQLREHEIPLALHVCGAAVERVLKAPLVGLGALPARLLFSRIQLNGPIPAENDGVIQFLTEWLGPSKLITQYDLNPSLHFRTDPHVHQVLFDASGGRGVLRETWPTPLAFHTCGYAGGLGPDTLEHALPAIAKAAANREYWIDMETGLRDSENAFCLKRARQVIAAVHRIESAVHDAQP